MKTKLYKSYAAATKRATSDCVFIGNSEETRFASRSDLRDYEDTPPVIERSFFCHYSTSKRVFRKRTLRVFRTRAGDFGFYAFGSGCGDEKRAICIFDTESEAVGYLNSCADSYINSESGWKEA